ncbi:hypothetical protein HRJ34_14810 [Rhizorhabdus wittichii]|uniref:DNA 5'-3' helicase n=1 Tax=Rhizorhabdus wittichii TaxID=160791 RepID=A0A975D0W1_9SPHN|nr:DnaB-like helicase C-terminal domain-containing protein [Rhizorhabdus wittichii]QTH19645.1 hypothetical protein HRJ34_14810 [Rhizorhabdus wittichii]
MTEPLRPAGQDQPVALVNEEAEYFLLGGMMLDNRLVPAVAEILREDQFYYGIHRKIFRAILKLTERGQAANAVTLRPFFEFDPEVAELLPNQPIGPYLAQSGGQGAVLIGILDMARMLADLAALRDVDDALGRHRTLLPTAIEDSVEEIVDRIEADLWSAVSARPAVAANSATSMIRKVIERNQRIVTAGTVDGYSCKLVKDVDRLIGEVEPGTYNIIGGRPGQGKTTLARSMALGYAMNGIPVEFFHAEMTEEQQAIYVAADLCHALGNPVAHEAIRKGNLTSVQLQALERAEAVAASLPVNYTATGRCDIRRIESMVARAKARWAAKGKKLGPVFVDYVQLLGASRNGREITEDTPRVAAVSKGLLDIAQKHGVPVFALSQLSRGAEDRKDFRPEVRDLKQAGDLEQDADSIILVFREETYLIKEQPKQGSQDYQRKYDAWETDFRAVRGVQELICGKNRHGKTSSRPVKFFGANAAVRGSDFDEFTPPADLAFDWGGGR